LFFTTAGEKYIITTVFSACAKPRDKRIRERSFKMQELTALKDNIKVADNLLI
jgi:hypothetical protein